MNLNFKIEDLVFQKQVRDFIKNNLSHITKKKTEEGYHLTKEDMVNWYNKLSKQGWIAPNWPKKYGGTDNWEMQDNKRDTYNPVNHSLFPNSDTTESTGRNVDFVNNGFKHRNSNGNTNESGQKYVFMAFAERPSATAFNSFPNAR